MNIEFEVKNIIREGETNEIRAEQIGSRTTFEKGKVLKALNKGGETISALYGNILVEHKK